MAFMQVRAGKLPIFAPSIKLEFLLMYTNLMFRAMVLMIICSSSSLFAQKPQAELGLAFGQPIEKEYLLQGNKRVDTRTGHSVVIYQTRSKLQRAEPEAMAQSYLWWNKGELGLTDDDLSNLKLHFVRESVVGTTIHLRQYWQGVRVQDAEVSLTVKPDLRVTMVHNFFAQDIDLADVSPAISADRAHALTVDYLNATGRLTDDTQELVILPQEGEARLAYRVRLNCLAPVGNWDAFVDAKTGEMLRVEDKAAYHKHHDEEKAFVPMPMMVDGTGNVFIPDPLSSAQVDYGDTGYTDNNDNTTPELIAQQVSVTLRDITLENGEYFLKGPWAEIVDIEAPFRGVFQQSTPDWSVDRDNNAFEAVNCYYHIDESMRYLNETLGLNIRPTNYTGGVRVDPSGFNGADNSRYNGGSQSLIFGDGGVDDAEDSDVIHHELGHGLHDWVTGGGISQNQGLSEGCGDYWAASYNRSLGDWEPTDPQYNWIFNWDGHNPFWNGRSCGISTTWSPNIPLGGIHAQGQVWATSMMLVYDAIGKTKTDIIFWEGLGMTNGNSNQNDAANAVYQAALSRPECTNAERQQVHTVLTDQGYQLPPFALPVSWLDVAATPQNKEVVVSWATASEHGSDYFEIERSLDGGRTFTNLGRVTAAGEATERTDYAFTDRSPAIGESAYRVRQADVDGTLGYSDVVTVTFGEQSLGALSPNPTNGWLRLQVPGEAPLQATVLDLEGRTLLQRQLGSEGGFSVLELPAGVYLLRYTLNREVVTRRFVKR